LQCLSNLRQLGTAIVMYCNDNHGCLPRCAPYTSGTRAQMPEDWLWWQQASSNTTQAPNRNVFQSPIMRYLNIKSPANGAALPKPDFNELRQAVLRCPSDNVPNHPIATGAEPDGNFYYSYTLNNLMQSDPSPNYVPTDPNTGKKFELAMKLSRVRNSATKLLLAEESEATIDDGGFNPLFGANLLSVRHDRTAHFPEAGSLPVLPNPKCKGNVAMCDGHAEYIARWLINDSNQHNEMRILPFK
jgi:prepilin-type processing-associated H-X9-DG protein